MSDLRIVAGEWRGRRIVVPEAQVRPTSDRVREAWMSIVGPSIDGARVIDLCAGSGALGLEALSRGAAHCDFVDRDPAVLKTLRKNIATLGAEERATVHRADVVEFLEDVEGAGGPWDLAFSDPPYKQKVARTLVERWLAAPFATIFGVEHEAELVLPDADTDARAADRRVYGGTAITLFRTDR